VVAPKLKHFPKNSGQLVAHQSTMIKDGNVVAAPPKAAAFTLNVFGLTLSKGTSAMLFLLSCVMFTLEGAIFLTIIAVAYDRFCGGERDGGDRSDSGIQPKWSRRKQGANVKGMKDLPPPPSPRGG